MNNGITLRQLDIDLIKHHVQINEGMTIYGVHNGVYPQTIELNPVQVNQLDIIFESMSDKDKRVFNSKLQNDESFYTIYKRMNGWVKS